MFSVWDKRKQLDYGPWDWVPKLLRRNPEPDPQNKQQRKGETHLSGSLVTNTQQTLRRTRLLWGGIKLADREGEIGQGEGQKELLLVFVELLIQ